MEKVNAMELRLPAKYRKMIENRVRAGKYGSAEDVIMAALMTLDGSEKYGDFAPGELDALVGEGEASAKREGVYSAEQVFKELRQRSARARRKARSS